MLTALVTNTLKKSNILSKKIPENTNTMYNWQNQSFHFWHQNVTNVAQSLGYFWDLFYEFLHLDKNISGISKLLNEYAFQ